MKSKDYKKTASAKKTMHFTMRKLFKVLREFFSQDLGAV
jgi:hypothetical protein